MDQNYKMFGYIFGLLNLFILFISFAVGNLFLALTSSVTFYLLIGLIVNKLLDCSDSTFNWFFSMTGISIKPVYNFVKSKFKK